MNSNHFFFPISEYSNIPELFTYPFHYDPHELCVKAAAEIQEYLTNSTWEHNFGLSENPNFLPVGKMFGVLIVTNKNGQLGYLRAYSGELLGNNTTTGFVPPVYDTKERSSFYDSTKKEVELINELITKIESDPKRNEALTNFLSEKERREKMIEMEKEIIRKSRTERRAKKNLAKNELSQDNFSTLNKTLKDQSLREKFFINSFIEYSKMKIDKFKILSNVYEHKYNELTLMRKKILSNLQEKQLKQFQFLNIQNKIAGIDDIFTFQGIKAPAGTGDCAAPKLLQFAFKNELMPIAMAEFWWGASPKSIIRHHQHFYPSCKSRCMPILKHMLSGIDVQQNPLLLNAGKDTKINILFEDEQMLVIDKPSGLLSVPGKNFTDSVAERFQKMFPESTGPLVVHRLDQCTSGIMLIAKDESTYKILQQQFIKRTIKKKYSAILDRPLEITSGTINLPLRVDLDNRPYQLVCNTHGKNAVTEYKVIEIIDGKTRIDFFPITGRTHQLRVHSAHPDGLNSPIVGDSLYGKNNDRLCLHASWIEFNHPKTNELISFTCLAPF